MDTVKIELTGKEAKVIELLAKKFGFPPNTVVKLIVDAWVSCAESRALFKDFAELEKHAPLNIIPDSLFEYDQNT